MKRETNPNPAPRKPAKSKPSNENRRTRPFVHEVDITSGPREKARSWNLVRFWQWESDMKVEGEGRIVRSVCQREIIPFAEIWEKTGAIEFFRKEYEAAKKAKRWRSFFGAAVVVSGTASMFSALAAVASLSIQISVFTAVMICLAVVSKILRDAVGAPKMSTNDLLRYSSMFGDSDQSVLKDDILERVVAVITKSAAFIREAVRFTTESARTILRPKCEERIFRASGDYHVEVVQISLHDVTEPTTERIVT